LLLSFAWLPLQVLLDLPRVMKILAVVPLERIVKKDFATRCFACALMGASYAHQTIAPHRRHTAIIPNCSRIE